MTWTMHGRQKRWAQCVMTGDLRASRHTAHCSSVPVSTISILSINWRRYSSALAASAAQYTTRSRSACQESPFQPSWSCITSAFYPSSCMALSAGQSPREMYSRLIPLISGVCGNYQEPNGTSTCGMMRWDGQPGNHTFQLLSKHGVSPNRCQDLNSFLLGELEETTRTSSYYVDKAIQQDLKSNNLSVKEAIDVAQNRPLWRLMSMFGTMHS